MLGLLGEMVMGRGSTIGDKNKCKEEITGATATTIIQILPIILNRKKNMVGYIQPMKLF
jgi:hypothetical protein